MPNPKSIESYSMQLRRLMILLARANTTGSQDYDFPTHGQLVTFRSRFYTLRKLMAKQQEEMGDLETARNLYRVGIKVTGDRTLTITNAVSSLPAGIEEKMAADLAEMERKLFAPNAEAETQTQTQTEEAKLQAEAENDSAIKRYYGTQQPPKPFDPYAFADTVGREGEMRNPDEDDTK